jgi:hypothetical protein
MTPDGFFSLTTYGVGELDEAFLGTIVAVRKGSKGQASRFGTLAFRAHTRELLNLGNKTIVDAAKAAGKGFCYEVVTSGATGQLIDLLLPGRRAALADPKRAAQLRVLVPADAAFVDSRADGSEAGEALLATAHRGQPPHKGKACGSQSL